MAGYLQRHYRPQEFTFTVRGIVSHERKISARGWMIGGMWPDGRFRFLRESDLMWAASPDRTVRYSSWIASFGSVHEGPRDSSFAVSISEDRNAFFRIQNKRI